MILSVRITRRRAPRPKQAQRGQIEPAAKESAVASGTALGRALNVSGQFLRAAIKPSEPRGFRVEIPRGRSWCGRKTGTAFQRGPLALAVRRKTCNAPSPLAHPVCPHNVLSAEHRTNQDTPAQQAQRAEQRGARSVATGKALYTWLPDATPARTVGHLIGVPCQRHTARAAAPREHAGARGHAGQCRRDLAVLLAVALTLYKCATSTEKFLLLDAKRVSSLAFTYTFQA